MGSKRSRSPSGTVRAAPLAGALDVYLFPAVVGGGLGDIAEVLDAGRILARAGFRPTLFRPPGRRLPAGVDDRWAWAEIRRVSRLAPRASRAVTVAPNWGVSAAPERPEPLGRGGPWAAEAAEVEHRYGSDRTLHVSLEEFARTLTSTEENAERWREGGSADRSLRRGPGGSQFRKDARTFHDAFRKFRAFDRPNVLHVFATFRPSSRFAREYPEAVQTGPVWPPGGRNRPEAVASAVATVVWYASPASSSRLVAEVDRGLRGTPVREVLVRSSRPLDLPSGSPIRWVAAEPMSAAAWDRRFRSAELRIVTGSRTLLEALAGAGPFLYYNGTLGEGRRRRRHRPEKIQALLAAWHSEGLTGPHARDLDAFSRGRRVAEVVHRAASDAAWRRTFPRGAPVGGFSEGRKDGGRFLVDVARAFARGEETSDSLVGRLRAGGASPRGHQD